MVGQAYAAFMIAKAVMDHQSKISAANAQRAWKYKKDLATVRKLKSVFKFKFKSVSSNSFTG